MKTTQEARQELYEALADFRRVLIKPFREPIQKLVNALNRIIKAFN